MNSIVFKEVMYIVERESNGEKIRSEREKGRKEEREGHTSARENLA